MPSNSTPKNRKTADIALQQQIEDLAHGVSSNPFAVLGRHPDGRGDIVRVFFPDALEVMVVSTPAKGLPLEQKMYRIHPHGVYSATIPKRSQRYFVRSDGLMAGRMLLILTVLENYWGIWTCICFQKVGIIHPMR